MIDTGRCKYGRLWRSVCLHTDSGCIGYDDDQLALQEDTCNSAQQQCDTQSITTRLLPAIPIIQDAVEINTHNPMFSA